MYRFALALGVFSLGTLAFAGTNFDRSCTDPGFSNQCDTLADGGSLSDQECLEVVNNMGSEGSDGAGNGINDSCCNSSHDKVFPGFDDATDACDNYDVKLINGGASIQVSVDINSTTCSGADCGPSVCGYREVLFQNFMQ